MIDENKRREAIKKVESMPDGWVWKGKSKQQWIDYLKKRRMSCAVLVAIRADESLSRRTILIQGDTTTGYYGQQYGVNTYSPVMDLTNEDVYRFFSVFDWHINDAYNKMFDAGIPLAHMRIGSIVNVHSGSSVSWIAQLDPGSYAKIVTRLDGVDFTANYGGKSNKSKFISIPQIQPFNEGRPTKSQAFAIELLGLEFKTYEE